jgi:hypothetical protein
MFTRAQNTCKLFLSELVDIISQGHAVHQCNNWHQVWITKDILQIQQRYQMHTTDNVNTVQYCQEHVN